MVTDIEDLEEVDASDIYSKKKTQYKGSAKAAMKWKLHIPSSRWNSQNLLRRTASENKIIFEENQTESLLQPHIKMTQHGMMRKLKMTSGVLQKISFIAITWNPESNCTCQEKNHFLFQ